MKPLTISSYISLGHSTSQGSQDGQCVARTNGHYQLNHILLNYRRGNWY